MASIIIIGGGIVGVCNALALQQTGHTVTLIDRGQPGREASYGNAGVLSESSVLVLNNPDLLKILPQLLLYRFNGFRYTPSFVARRLGWFFRFLAHCTPHQARHAAQALRNLQVLSLNQHKQWIKAAEVGHLLRHAGWMKVFRSQKSFRKFQYELDMMRQVGVPFTVYEREQLRQIEPGLKPIYEKAILMDATCSVSSPSDLTDAYVRLFTDAGGSVRQATVTGLSEADRGWRVALATSDGMALAEHVVIAAGAWSSEIASWLGYDVPLAWERGYHMHFAQGDRPPLRRAIHDFAAGCILAPMRQGIRITTGVEIAARDAPKNFSQIKKAIINASEAYEIKQPLDDEPWMGRRPTLIDSLPIIGPAPRHARLWFNFGHQHVGLSMAPGSGLAIAAMMAGRPPPVDCAPFRAARFTL